MIAFLNGRFLSEAKCLVSATDSGFLYGDGAYDTLRAYGGTILFLQEHLQRLFTNLRALMIHPPMDIRGFRFVLTTLLSKNRLKDALLRITVTRGRVLSGSPDFSWASPSVFIMARPFSGYPHRYYEKGVKVVTYPWPRGKKFTVKSTSFQGHLLARVDARRKGAFETLLVDDKGYALEGSMSNVFIFQGNRLVTPALRLGILPGITRAKVLEGAQRMGIRVREGLVSLRSIRSSQGAFLTSTSMECLPIGWLDGQRLKLPDPKLLSGIWKEGCR